MNAVLARRRRLTDGGPTPKDLSGLRWLTEADAGALAHATGADRAVIRQRLADGHRAVIMEKDGAIIGMTWCVPGGYLNDWIHVKIPPRCMWKSDIWVAHEHRGKGLAVKIKQFTDSENFRRGFEYNYSFSDALNKAARGYGDRNGTETLARLFYIRLFNLTLVRFCGEFHCGRWSEQRPFVVDLTDAG